MGDARSIRAAPVCLANAGVPFEQIGAGTYTSLLDFCSASLSGSCSSRAERVWPARACREDSSQRSAGLDVRSCHAAWNQSSVRRGAGRTPVTIVSPVRRSPEMSLPRPRRAARLGFVQTVWINCPTEATFLLGHRLLTPLWAACVPHVASTQRRARVVHS